MHHDDGGAARSRHRTPLLVDRRRNALRLPALRECRARLSREHGLKTHTLSYWVNRRSRSDGEKGLKFVELSAEARAGAGNGLKYDVVLPSGITIKVGDDVNAAVVGQLAGVLGGGR